MKTLFLAIVCAVLIIAGGCITCMKNCPPHDVVFSIGTPIGPMPVKMKKGHLNPDKEKETWIGADEFEMQMNQSQGQEEETQELIEGDKAHGI